MPYPTKSTGASIAPSGCWSRLERTEFSPFEVVVGEELDPGGDPPGGHGGERAVDSVAGRRGSQESGGAREERQGAKR